MLDHLHLLFCSQITLYMKLFLKVGAFLSAFKCLSSSKCPNFFPQIDLGLPLLGQLYSSIFLIV